MKFTATGFSRQELVFVRKVLDDPRAWGVKFTLVDASVPHDIAIHLLSSADIDDIFAEHPHLHGLSVTDRTNKPIRIYFSAENWRKTPQASGFSNLFDYRTYLVLHEFGHAMGKGHEPCISGRAPVMMQQTLGTGSCYPYPWVK